MSKNQPGAGEIQRPAVEGRDRAERSGRQAEACPQPSGRGDQAEAARRGRVCQAGVCLLSDGGRGGKSADVSTEHTDPASAAT